MKYSLNILLILMTSTAFSQFKGHSGIYFLGTADTPIPENIYEIQNISGLVCRFKWESIEPSPGNFNWDFVDNEILKAQEANKKISLQPLGKPDWIKTELNADSYYYIDKNNYHNTYGQVLSSILPWDDIYLNRLKILIKEMATKYADNNTVSYINAIGGNISRNLPDTVVIDVESLTKAPFWNTFNYDAITLANKMNEITDYYMSLFPATPLWCSVDYVSFEPFSSSKLRNYLASLYTSYGIDHYPDRFGLFREDISACTTNSPTNGSQWFIMDNNKDRTGAQMLWNVQDEPNFRMNKCGKVSSPTKASVMDSAINQALKYGMRYIEVYGIDILDQSLTTIIDKANQLLIKQGHNSLDDSSIKTTEKENNNIKIHPNPTKDRIYIEAKEQICKKVQLFSLEGQLVIETNTNEISLFHLPEGIYYLFLTTNKRASIHKVLKIAG